MDASIQQSHEQVIKAGQTAELIAVAQAVNKLKHVPPSQNRSSSLKVIRKDHFRGEIGFSRELPSKPTAPLASSTPEPHPTKSYTQQKPVIETTKFDEILENIPKHTKVILFSDGSVSCLDQGNFPHPKSCKKFISCALMQNGDIKGWQYSCPENLSFDPIGGMCNWSMDVGCDESEI